MTNLFFPAQHLDVSSELGARLRVELEQTERLDAQFVEYLRCRGINPTVNTDSAAGSMSYSDDLLSPELQVGPNLLSSYFVIGWGRPGFLLSY